MASTIQERQPMDSRHDQGKGSQRREGGRTRALYRCSLSREARHSRQSKRFKDVAKLAVDRMEKAMAAGEGRSVYRDYVQAINNYLIPFFGTHHVDHITYPLIQAFAAWRSEKMGKEPKASTINTYNSALNRIFDEALMRGYIAKTQVPSRIVLIEFKDYATALECYRSPEYAKATAIHKNTADADIIILDGYEGPQPTDA
jgi:uncharacterized protein (DUF1330 family)